MPTKATKTRSGRATTAFDLDSKEVQDIVGDGDDPEDLTYKKTGIRPSWQASVYEGLKKAQTTSKGDLVCGLFSSGKCVVDAKSGIIKLDSSGNEDTTGQGYKNVGRPPIDHHGPDWIVRLTKILALDKSKHQAEIQKQFNAQPLRVTHKKCNLSRPKS